MENTRVNNIRFDNNRHWVETSQGNVVVTVACGAFGKRSNMDVKWKRSFISRSKNKLNNFIGVKYHIKTDLPPDTIALHLFPQGYCGIVKIEKDIYNLCYLTTAANLQAAGGNIAGMERTTLCVNPQLKKIFSESERIHQNPFTISQISFDKKNQVNQHVLLAGDAASMITPLCGNGMSMALHASKILASAVHHFLDNRISRKNMELHYQSQWQGQFGQRLRTGRFIQHMFANEWLTNFAISTIRRFPRIGDQLIRLTHGRPF